MERLRKPGHTGLTSAALRTWGMLFVAVGIIGRSILQNRILGIGTLTGKELLELLNANSATMAIATAALVLQAAETCAVPIFAFLLAEGFAHTKDWKQYLLRLLGIAALSELPYNLAISGKLWDAGTRNPVFALAIGLILLYFFRQYGEKQAKHAAIRLAVLIAGVLWTVMLQIEHGIMLVLLIALFWALRSKASMRTLAGAVVSVVFSVLSPFYLASPMGFLPIHLYGGQQGEGNRIFRYLCYPVLLSAVGIAALLLF